MFVGLLVCWSAFYRPHDICPLCGAASEWPRAGSAVAGGPARAGKRMHSESTRAHAVQLLNEKIAALMHFKNKIVRARWSEPTLVSSYDHEPADGKRALMAYFGQN